MCVSNDLFYKDTLVHSFRIDPHQVHFYETQDCRKILKLWVSQGEPSCKLAYAFTKLKTAKFGGLGLLEASPPWKKANLCMLADVCVNKCKGDSNKIIVLFERSVRELSDNEFLEVGTPVVANSTAPSSPCRVSMD